MSRFQRYLFRSEKIRSCQVARSSKMANLFKRVSPKRFRLPRTYEPLHLSFPDLTFWNWIFQPTRQFYSAAKSMVQYTSISRVRRFLHLLPHRRRPLKIYCWSVFVIYILVIHLLLLRYLFYWFLFRYSGCHCCLRAHLKKRHELLAIYLCGKLGINLLHMSLGWFSAFVLINCRAEVWYLTFCVSNVYTFNLQYFPINQRKFVENLCIKQK